MPDTKISDLTAASALTLADLIEVVQGGTNKKAALSILATLIMDNMADPSTATILVDDFVGGSLETGEIGELGWSFSNGAVSQAPAAGRPGVISRTSGATASQIAQVFLGNSANIGPVYWSDFDQTTFILNFTTAGTDFSSELGAAANWSQVASGSAGNAAYFQRLSTDTNWFACTRNNTGTATRVDTGIAFATGWNKFRIRQISSASYGFSINDGTETVVNTNSPDTAGRFIPGVNITPTTTTARIVLIDFFMLKLKPLTR